MNRRIARLLSLFLLGTSGCAKKSESAVGILDVHDYIKTVEPGSPQCPGNDKISCELLRSVSLCNDIVVRLPALALELKKKETRRRNIGSAVTIAIGAAGSVITATIASTQEASGEEVKNKNATIISAGITGASSIAAAVTTVVVGNGYADQIDLAGKVTEQIATETAKVINECNIEQTPIPKKCEFEAKRLRELCISGADAAQLRIRDRHKGE